MMTTIKIPVDLKTEPLSKETKKLEAEVEKAINEKDNRPKVLIIGFGYVGQGAYNMFKNHYDVYVYEPSIAVKKEFPEVCFIAEPELTHGLGTKLLDDDNGFGKEYSMANPFDLAIVCVPTPMDKNKWIEVDGMKIYACDYSIVEEVVAKVRAQIILIKSTIEPGTTDMLSVKYQKRIVFSPEFLGEGTYHSTYEYHKKMETCPWITLGGDRKDVERIHDLMIPIVGPQKIWHFLTSTEAELSKYKENAYFAVKVIFANLFFDACITAGAFWEKVRQAWGADTRVDIMHTAVFPDKRGFRGKCLPKDINAITYWMIKNQIDASLLVAILKYNLKLICKKDYLEV